MALIEINKEPSQRELTLMGIGFPIFFGIIGGVVFAATGSIEIPRIIWGAGAAVTVIFFAIPRTQRPIYLGWMYLAFPIGWTISHVLLGAVYYLLLSPVGLFMRLIGRDPMHRKYDTAATSYYEDHTDAETGRYFRQF